VIVQEGGGPQGGLIAELCDPLGDKVVSRAVVVPAGEFAFEAVTPGQYRLRIAAWGGEILAQRVVSAGSDGTPVEIRLERLGQTAPATVSLAQLQHHVPSRAARELGREARAFAEGDIQGAIAHLRRALEIDPSFMEAHNNLGVRYMALNRFEDAAAEFRRAIELDPAADKAFANLAGALLLLGRDEEAEVAARRAVALAPAYFQGHDLLARVLVAEGKSRDEAAREFTRATRLRR
jgi:Flp pilus assembly protein TadD